MAYLVTVVLACLKLGLELILFYCCLLRLVLELYGRRPTPAYFTEPFLNSSYYYCLCC